MKPWEVKKTCQGHVSGKLDVSLIFKHKTSQFQEYDSFRQTPNRLGKELRWLQLQGCALVLVWGTWLHTFPLSTQGYYQMEMTKQIRSRFPVFCLANVPWLILRHLSQSPALWQHVINGTTGRVGCETLCNRRGRGWNYSKPSRAEEV